MINKSYRAIAGNLGFLDRVAFEESFRFVPNDCTVSLLMGKNASGECKVATHERVWFTRRAGNCFAIVRHEFSILGPPIMKKMIKNNIQVHVLIGSTHRRIESLRFLYYHNHRSYSTISFLSRIESTAKYEKQRSIFRDKLPTKRNESNRIAVNIQHWWKSCTVTHIPALFSNIVVCNLEHVKHDRPQLSNKHGRFEIIS